MRPRWKFRMIARNVKVSMYASSWIILISVVLLSMIRSFPSSMGSGNMVYIVGRLGGVLGLMLLGLVITSRNLFTYLGKVVHPARLDKYLRMIEVFGLTVIFLHPLVLVTGRYLMGSPDPWEIIVPSLSIHFQAFISPGCISFWMLFMAGLFFLNRNRVTFNHMWKYVHALIYPAFLLSFLHATGIGIVTSESLVSSGMTVLFYTVSFTTIFKAIALVAGRVYSKRGGMDEKRK